MEGQVNAAVTRTGHTTQVSANQRGGVLPRQVQPVSRNWGFDRGAPVDRYYIENFLAAHAVDIFGRVLEIGDNAYTRRFGGVRVTRSDVLNFRGDIPGTTFVGDLTKAERIPSEIFDCIVLTQTLQFIYDTRAAVRTLYRILRPGGVVLATMSGITGIGDADWRESWCWNFTRTSACRVFEECFGTGHVQGQSYGNVLSASAFLYGHAHQELSQVEMDYNDPDYQVTVAVRACKPNSGGAMQRARSVVTKVVNRLRAAWSSTQAA